MKTKIIISLFVLIPLLVTNIALAEKPAPGHPEPSGEPSEIDTYIFDAENLKLAPVAGNTDLAVHNQGWMPEKPNKFKPFKYEHWATIIKALAPGYYWVGISIPLITYLDGVAQRIKYVEFCADSSKGAKSKPTAWEIYERRNIVWSGNINWPADNDTHCIGHTFSPAIWKQDLGISVYLYFKNKDHIIYMEKAWVKTIP